MKEEELTSLVAQDLGIENLTPDMQKDILARLGEAALKSALLEVFDKLPANGEEAFKKIAEEGDLAKTQYFLKEQVPEYDSIVKRSIAKVVDEFKKNKAGLS